MTFECTQSRALSQITASLTRGNLAEREDAIYSLPWTQTEKSQSLGQTQALSTCEGGGDVVGVVTPLVGGVAQAFHDDQVVELRVQFGEDKEGQVEVEEERRLKEVRSWMIMSQ